MRPSGERRGKDRFLTAKMTLFVAGAAVGLTAMATGSPMFGWVAIGLVVTAFMLRFADRRRGVYPGDVEDSEEPRER